MNEYSITHGGVTGDFEITYKCNGIESNFECDMTIGNLHCFYIELGNAYDIQFGKDTVASLQDYSGKRTKLVFKFDRKGHLFVDGFFKNKSNSYKSSISFEKIELDQTYIPEILGTIGNFLNEIERIQGHHNFY